MGINKGRSKGTAAAELRRQSEERLQAKTARENQSLPEETAQWLIHELEVHQVELEMQNVELIQARDEADSALKKYSDLFDFAPVGYFVLDINGNILDVNLTGANFFGYERLKLIGRRFGLFVPENVREFFADFLEKVIASQRKESCEMRITTKSDSHLFLQIEAIALGSMHECLMAVIDISDRRRAEEMIAQLNTDLMAANAELETFSYTVAHDLRQPLNVIYSFSQLLEMQFGDQLQVECKGYVQEIFNGAKRMNCLITALLNFSRAGHDNLRREMVDLSALATEVVKMLKMNGPERKIDFRIAPEIKANADLDLLRVVLDNILGNAWKYTAQRETGIVELGVVDGEGEPVYFVRDNGIGFDNAAAGKLFTAFQRLSNTDEFKGSGIGLATVERIIRRHGGKIWADGKPGVGSTFYFTLSSDQVLN